MQAPFAIKQMSIYAGEGFFCALNIGCCKSNSTEN